MRKTDGGGAGDEVSIEVMLNSSDRIEIESGLVSLQGGGNLAGILDIGVSANLALRNGIFVAEALAQLANQGQGTLIVDGATSQVLNLIILAAPILGFPSVSLQNIELRTGGEISGAADLEILGSLTWRGGRMSGPGKTLIAMGANMFIAGNVSSNRNLENRGTTEIKSGSTLTLSSLQPNIACALDNFGLLILRGDVSISTDIDPASLVNRNGGLIRKLEAFPLGPVGTAQLEVFFANQGNVDIDQGQLRVLRRNTEHSPTSVTHINTDASFYLVGRTHNFLGGGLVGATVFGNGEFRVDQGNNVNNPPILTLNYGPNASVSVGSFRFDGPNNHILGDAHFSCDTFFWLTGSIDQNTLVTIGNGKTMEIDGPVALLGNATITNHGSVRWKRVPLDPGNLTMSQNASITNDGQFGEGIFRIESPGAVLDGTPAGQQSIIKIEMRNGGVMTFDDGSGENRIEANLVNNGGELNLNGRTITLSQKTGLPAWNYTPIGGDTNLNGGVLYIEGQFTQTGGATILQGQLPLKRYCGKDFSQKLFAPAARSTFHDDAVFGGMLF